MKRMVYASMILFAACDSRRDGAPRDSGPVLAVDSGTSSGLDGSATNDCTEAARWVYVLDSNRTLMQFRPDDLVFTTIGALDCASDATPFSMAVDRDGRAWVLYQNGAMFSVSTADASCSPTTFTPNQAGFELFGMGFASDAEGSEAETLYVAGGPMASIAMGSSTLGTIDEASLVLTSLGTLPGWPELTGTAFDLSAVGSGMPAAWAFAFWGGRFYVFLQSAADLSTNVWRVDPTDSSVTRVLENTGFRIVGAGVSTCAPTELI
jgi:hypothetical protein